jgi:HPt (histidine-containing phosphotransfer) domain-containing protein
MRRVRNREDRLLKLVTMFTADMPDRMKRLDEALGREDIAAVADISHLIKGVAGNLSAEQLTQQCKELGQACRKQDTAPFAKLRQPIQDDFKQLIRLLEVFVSSQQGHD